MPRLNNQEGNGVADNPPVRPVAVKRAISLRATVPEDNIENEPVINTGIKRSDSDKVANQVNINSNEWNEICDKSVHICQKKANSDENEDVFLRTPTTAQRRQMFQDRINSVQSDKEAGSLAVDSSAAVSTVAASPLPKRATRIFGLTTAFPILTYGMFALLDYLKMK